VAAIQPPTPVAQVLGQPLHLPKTGDISPEALLPVLLMGFLLLLVGRSIRRARA